MSIAINNNSYRYGDLSISGYDNRRSIDSTAKDKSAQEINKTGKVECQTCKNRKYQDISNDSGVSFKTPGKIDAGSSASVVKSHELEHVRHQLADAAKDSKQIVSQTVTLHTSVCPECGRSYVSGGNTKTVTKTTSESNTKDYFLTNYNDTIAKNFGLVFDVRV
jgi:DNA-directed RNA polymerase subunit M/transcription elongation factor TFIIS